MRVKLQQGLGCKAVSQTTERCPLRCAQLRFEFNLRGNRSRSGNNAVIRFEVVRQTVSFDCHTNGPIGLGDASNTRFKSHRIAEPARNAERQLIVAAAYTVSLPFCGIAAFRELLDVTQERKLFWIGDKKPAHHLSRCT